MDLDSKPSMEGLRHARNLLHKQLQKERQRTAELQRRNRLLREELEKLREKLPNDLELE